MSYRLNKLGIQCRVFVNIGFANFSHLIIEKKKISMFCGSSSAD